MEFNNTIFTKLATPKHLAMVLDASLDFQEHAKDKLSKVSKAIGLSRQVLLRPYLQSNSPLLDPILTMVISIPYMTKHIMPNFIKTSM